MKIVSIKEQLIKARRENEKLKAELAKANADTQYIAMMTDIELEEDTDEQEV